MVSECGPVFLSGGLEKGEGASVNDGISLLFITLLLIKIVHLVSRLGKGALYGAPFVKKMI